MPPAIALGRSSLTTRSFGTLAVTEGVPLADLAPASLFLDGVHPNPRGAALLARTVSAILERVAD